MKGAGGMLHSQAATDSLSEVVAALTLSEGYIEHIEISHPPPALHPLFHISTFHNIFSNICLHVFSCCSSSILGSNRPNITKNIIEKAKQ